MANSTLTGVTLKEHFNWKHHPFLDNSPGYFLTQREEKIQTTALEFLRNGKSFALTGPSGSGKTTLLHLLKRELEPASFSVAEIPYGGLLRNGILKTLADLFRLDSGKRTLPTLTRIQNHLSTLQKGTQSPFPVIVLDDAQHLELNTLLDMCSLLNQNNRPSAAMILAGDETLPKKLRLTIMDPVSTRLSCTFQLKPLASEETTKFLRARMEVAKVSKELLKPDLLELLAVRCRGNRRVLLNTVANLCQEAWERQEKTITADLALSSDYLNSDG